LELVIQAVDEVLVKSNKAPCCFVATGLIRMKWYKANNYGACIDGGK
jgi:hypothetical protein